jgi:hypothetical protein
VNAQAERWWGRRRDALIGRHFWSEFPEAVGTEGYRMHLLVMAERRPVHFETLSAVIHRPIEVHIYPEAGGGLSCYFRDLAKPFSPDEIVGEVERVFRLTGR